MWHPLAGLSSSGLVWLFTVALVGSGFAFFALETLARRLRTKVAPRGIASLESADTPDSCQRILDSWDDLSLQAAERHLTVDFIFIPLYTTLLTILGITASRWFAASGFIWLSNFAMILAWSQWLIGLLDIASNCSMLRTLQVSPNVPDGLPQMSAWCSRIKTFILFMSGIFGLLGLLTSFTA